MLRPIIRIGNVEIMNENYVGILKQPIATAMKRRQNCTVNLFLTRQNPRLNFLEKRNLSSSYITSIDTLLERNVLRNGNEKVK